MENFIELANLILPATLIPVFPLVGFLLLSLFGKQLGSLSGWIGSATVLASFVVSVCLFLNLPAAQELNFDLATWLRWGAVNLSFGILVDPLTVLMLLIITGIGFLIHLYSIGYMHGDEGFTRFFSYLNLFIFFMLVLVMGNSYITMFIGWEGVGLCSYLLIGFWFKNDAYNDAAKKAFIMNRVGDLGFLLGMFFMLTSFGTVDFNGVNQAASGFVPGDAMLTTITLLLFVGAIGKSAQIPLFTWLPDAMAGPTPVSALIHAATMVTAGIYMVCRSGYLYSLAPVSMEVVMWIGVATSLYAAIVGVKQNDIKKVLAYSTVSQLGLMFAALGIGAFSSGMFHVMTHAFFKALLFLGAGSVIHAMGGEQDIRNMGGLGKYIRITWLTFLIATLAISGIFPFAGFFSKDEILAHAFQSHWPVWALLSFSSMITAFYMFRLFFLTFNRDFRGTEHQKHHIHESPWTMTLPLSILAIFSILVGFTGMPEAFGQENFIRHYLDPVFAQANATLAVSHGMEHSTEWMLMGIATLAALVSIGIAYQKYISSKTLPEPDADLRGFSKWVSAKFYVDEFYDRLIVRPIQVLSDVLFVLVDKLIVDLIVMATAWLVGFTGRTIRLIQTGNTGFYFFYMVIAMMAFMLFQLVY